jgi:hypothetical protein
VKICEGKFYSFYTYFKLKYTQDELFAFKGLLDCNNQSIHMKWVANLNSKEENLAFLCDGEIFWQCIVITPLESKRWLLRRLFVNNVKE